MGYVPAERKTEGMVGGMIGRREHGARPHRQEGAVRQHRGKRKKLGNGVVRDSWTSGPRHPSLHLHRFSGGNQQKVVMAKWLQSETLKLLILDHPLRGLDPGAAETVNEQIRAARDGGTAVILLADTLEEALDMGDDILVMRDGEVTARFDLTVDTPTTLDLLERMV